MASKVDVCEGIADMVTEQLSGDLPAVFARLPWTALNWDDGVDHMEGDSHFLVQVDGDWFRVTVTKAQQARWTFRRARPGERSSRAPTSVH